MKKLEELKMLVGFNSTNHHFFVKGSDEKQISMNNNRLINSAAINWKPATQRPIDARVVLTLAARGRRYAVFFNFFNQRTKLWGISHNRVTHWTELPL